MNSLIMPWAQYVLPLSLLLLSMGVMGSRPVITSTYIQLTMASYENSIYRFIGDCTSKIHPPNFPVIDIPLTSTLENSPNCPPVDFLVPSTSSYTCFPNTNTTSYYYNHLGTIYILKTPLKPLTNPLL